MIIRILPKYIQCCESIGNFEVVSSPIINKESKKETKDHSQAEYDNQFDEG